MSDAKRPIIVYAAPIGWFGGWMFTVGYAHLGALKAFIGLVIWPAILGSVLSP